MKTLILIILDESSSMGPNQSDVVRRYNKFIKKQKEIKEDCTRLHLVKFNTVVSTVHSGLPLAEVPNLSIKNYTPDGSTALFDAIAFAVRVADNDKSVDERVICLIITDGEENSSQETTKEQVKNIITTHEAKGDWTFLYIGENPDQWTKFNEMSTSHGICYDDDDVCFEMAEEAVGRFRKGDEKQVKSGLFNSL